MVNLVGVDRFDDAKLVGDFRGVGNNSSSMPDSPCCVIKFGRDDGEAVLAGGHAGEALSAANGFGQVRAVERVHLGLVVEEVLLCGASGLEQVDDALGLWGEVGVSEGAAPGGRNGGVAIAGHERAEGGDADARAGAAEELSAGDMLEFLDFEFHGPVSRDSCYRTIINR